MAAVMDLYSRRIVGWPMKANMTSQLVTDALMMALHRRGRPRKVLHHSDQGSQYTSEQFQALLADSGIVCSMSKRGDCWDNAAMESFFSTLKTERLSRRIHRSRDECRAEVFDTSNGSTTCGASTQRWDTSAPCSLKQQLVRLDNLSEGMGQAQLTDFAQTGRGHTHCNRSAQQLDENHGPTFPIRTLINALHACKGPLRQLHPLAWLEKTLWFALYSCLLCSEEVNQTILDLGRFSSEAH